MTGSGTSEKVGERTENDSVFMLVLVFELVFIVSSEQREEI
jgi:hypothetical protein